MNLSDFIDKELNEAVVMRALMCKMNWSPVEIALTPLQKTNNKKRGSAGPDST